MPSIDSSNHLSDVTVGILTYNTPSTTVQKTIHSIISSSPGVKIILACNNPSVAIQSEMQNFASTLNVNFLGDLPNRGFGAGHNQILTIVDTKYYICCNPDIIVAPSCIQRLVDKAETIPNFGLLAPKVLNPDYTIQRLARKHLTLTNWISRQLSRLFKIPTFESKFDYDKYQAIEFVSGCFFLSKTANLRAQGGFDERFFMYCEDADLSRRISTHSKNYYVPDAIIIHEWHKGWARSAKTFFVHLHSLMLYFRKHGFFR